MKRLALLLVLAAFAVPLQAQHNANNARGFDAEKVYQIGDIDHVNVFNGNLLLTLPIGQKYQVSDHLSWGLTLVYNGNPWNYRVSQNSEPIPSRFMNAGLGWQLSFGELVGPYDTLSTSMGVDGSWVYAAPDGAERTFLPRLHAEEVGTAFEAPGIPGDGEVVGYTRDSSYLRLRRIGARFLRTETRIDPEDPEGPPGGTRTVYIFVADYHIEFPDGTRHTLTSAEYEHDTNVPPDAAYERSLRFRTTKMEDRFGNSVTIDYTDNDMPGEASATWTIKENAGTTLLRTHTVSVGTDTFTQLGFSTQSRRRVESVALTAFDGKVVTYTFAYSGNKTISTPCVAAYNPPPKTTGNFLESVSATETSGETTTTLSSYSMQYYDVIQDGDGNVVCSQHAGHLKSIGLPTGGTIEYTAGTRLFPSEKTGDNGPGLPPDVSTAVETRTVTNTDGTKEVTAYKSHLHTPATYTDPDTNQQRTMSTHMTVAVTDPLGHLTHNHFFVARIGGTGTCFSGATSHEQYGLPFVRIAGTTESDLLLSSEAYDSACKTFALNGCKPACKSATAAVLTPIRRAYVKYDLDTSESVLEFPRPPGYNQRVSASHTQFVDSSCGSQKCFTEMRLTDFDGLGHYRKETRSSNFPITAPRETETSYNANTNRGTYTPAGNPVPQAYMIATDSEWLLNLHDQVKATQGTTSAVTQLCFDRATGFLSRRRLLSGTAPGSRDLLTVLTSSDGNVDSEALYGGDVAPLDAMTDGCADSPGAASYKIDHTYESGVRKSSEYVLTSTTKLSALDLTIDGNTGLPKESRDTASITTSYQYDVLGRLSRVTPTGEAWTRYTYDLASRPASVGVETFATTVTDVTDTTERLAHRRLYYDGLGRLIQTREQLPSGWTVTESTYDLLGRRKTTSIAVAATSGDYAALDTGTRTTTFDYDLFGRPKSVATPDGKSTTFTYEGIRVVRRTVDVGGVSSTTTETYDGHGRLVEVKEGPTLGGVTASYSYDLGDRLTSVTMFDQTREFQYDGRGLLLSETHPETGPAGNGTTYYGTLSGTTIAPAYDARGRMTRRIVGTVNGRYDLQYSYDKAERLTRVEDIDPANTSQRRTLESFEYADANSGSDLRKGKLVTAIRNNYTADLGKIEVSETYKYENPAGRPTSRETVVTGTATFTGATFTLGQTLNELGQLATVTYPSTASMAAPARTITNTYSAGRLTGVTGYATISYQATGLIDTVTHGSGSSAVNEKWTADPNGMARPGRIEVSGDNLTTWTYGDYAYDGAGNITRIGNQEFSYDGMSRLIGWTETVPYGVDSVQRTLDVYGNFLESMYSGFRSYPDGRMQTYTSAVVANVVDPASNHYQSETYDDVGSVVADGRHTYGYDATGMLISIDGTGRKDRFLYTADRERIAVIDAQMNNTTWTLRGTGNNLLRTFTRAGLTGGSWNWTEDEIWRGGHLLARETTAGRQRFHLDHLGSPRLVTDGSGFRVGEQQFQPFGLGGTSDGGRVQFTGHERDVVRWPGVHRALDYLHARYYDPDLGRFLSVDPHLDIGKALREPQRWNRYGYVVNNPLRYTDPDGRDTRDFFDALVPAAVATGSDLVRLGKEAVHAAQIREAFQGFEGAPATEKAMAIAIAGIAIADVSTHFAAPGRSAVQQASTKAGAIVLGHFPGNKLVAQKIGAEFLNIANWTFGRNRGWLRDALRAGKDIYLTVDPSKVRLDSTTKRELKYLAKRGWEFVYESESGLWKAVQAAK